MTKTRRKSKSKRPPQPTPEPKPLAVKLSAPTDSSWKLTLLGVVAMVALVLAVYSPAMNGDFIMDDAEWLWNNKMTERSVGIFQFWWPDKADKPLDYWPLTSGMHWAQYRLWDRNPTGYHVVNMLMHALACVLIWRILRRLALPGAWLAAAIYAVHPICVGSVGWIAELKNMLSMVLFATSILMFLRFDDDGKRRWYALSIFAFFLALVSKTSIIMLPVVLLGIIWWKRGRIGRKDLALSLPLFALAVGFGIVTMMFQQKPTITANLIAEPASFIERIALSGRIFWFYVAKTLWPTNLAMIYERWDPAVTSAAAFLPTGLMLACAATVLVLAARGVRWLAMGLGFFVVTMLPVMSFLTMSYMKYSFVADHLVYVSIVGLIALLICSGATIAAKLPKAGRYAAIGCGAALLAGLSYLSFQQAAVFKGSVSLWTQTIKVNQGSWTAWSNRAVKYEEQGNLKAALEGHTKAIELDDRYSSNWSNRAITWDKLGEHDKAISDFTRAIEINLRSGKTGDGRAIRMDPAFAKAFGGRAVAYSHKQQYDLAIKDFNMALRFDPKNPEVMNNLAIVYKDAGQYDNAIATVTKAIGLKPNYAVAFNTRGATYIKMGELGMALADYDQAITLEPNYAQAYTNRGNLYMARKDYDRALKDYAKAMGTQAKAMQYIAAKLAGSNEFELAEAWHNKLVQQWPRDAESYYHRAVFFNGRKRHTEAIVDFDTAIDLQPDFAKAYNNRGISYASLGDIQQALKDFSKAIELQPDYPGAIKNRNQAIIMLRQRQPASKP